MKIDGRKAEITEPGRRFPDYLKFAVKHGYPDAAFDRRKGSVDTRKRPQEGDVVTLLVSGAHDSAYKGDTLWIVEAANGERHIMNEKGLRILDDDAAPITGVTVIPDESLGGLLREYREVKRKARVGERIKITYENHAWPGDTAIIESIDYGGDPSWSDSGESYYVEADWYVVLEPTDIVYVDGSKYRMVDRKAAVGERVVVVSGAASEAAGCIFRHEIGDIGVVDYVLSDRANFNGWYLVDGDYRVLEPVTCGAESELSTRPATEQAAENIAALTAKVQALESRVAALEDERKLAKVASGPVDTTPPSFMLPQKSAKLESAKTAQEIRDEIVERAKADIEGVKTPWNISANPQPLVYAFGMYVVDVEFVIDRDKRTVVAIARWGYNGKVVSRGIAKCAPNDVFNAHIGRAIALRRALGLEIPAEYLSVPNPETVRVGDVVDETKYYNRKNRVVEALRPPGYGDADKGLTFVGGGWAYIDACQIVDDTRESEKGAAA